MTIDVVRPLLASSMKAYARWSLAVALVFFPVYHWCNWFTAHYRDVYRLYLDVELQIPFIPQFFWAYISVYVLILFPPFFLREEQIAKLGKQLIAVIIIAGFVFLLLPSQLGFARIIPDDPFYASLFKLMFSLDLPYNMMPSLHITLSALILMALKDGTTQSVPLNILWASWFTLIVLSTIFVHQHHLIDIVTGLILAVLANRIFLIKK